MKNTRELVSFWHEEVIGKDKKFSFFRLYARMRNKPGLKFVFWWRLANHLYCNGHKRLAYKIHARLKKISPATLCLAPGLVPDEPSPITWAW